MQVLMAKAANSRELPAKIIDFSAFKT